MFYVLTSETGMVLKRLMCLPMTNNGPMVKLRWCGLPESEDTLETISQIYEDEPHLFLKSLHRENMPQDFVLH